MSTTVIFLGIPSLVALTLVVVHATRNRGRASVALYFIALAIYSALRAFAIDLVQDTSTPHPYLMSTQTLKFGFVSVQEIVGWSLALTVSWLIADRLLLRLRVRPAPHRVALLSALGMAVICLAVETAAISSGWWEWTIRQSTSGLLGRVPPVALLDWGFVAFDFLLAYLLFATPSSLASRLTALTLFPLHFWSHSRVEPLTESIPLAPYDLVHAGVIAYVVYRAIGERGESALPRPANERGFWMPFAAALIIAAATGLADVLVAGEVQAVLASLPLLLAAFAALAIPFREPEAEPAPPEPVRTGPGVWAARIVAVLVIFGVAFVMRAPFHRQTQQVRQSWERAVAHINAGEITAAIDEFEVAVAARPDHTSTRTMLAHLLILEGQRNGKQARWDEARDLLDEARKHLEVALALKPTDRSMLLNLTALDILHGRWDDATEHAARGLALYGERPEFLYLGALAAARGKEAAIQPAFEAARQAGEEGDLDRVESLKTAAMLMGDRRTVEACKTLLATPANPE